MEDERYELHDWERREIYVKGKHDTIVQMVSETILSLRRFLVDKKIQELSESFKSDEPQEESEFILQEVMDYIGLKRLISNRLNRVIL